MKELSKEYNFRTCTRCFISTQGDSDLLQEVAYSEDRYLPDLLKQALDDKDSALYREAYKQMEQRPQQADLPEIDSSLLEESEDEDIEGMFRTDNDQEPGEGIGLPKTETDEVNEEDIRKVLEEYERKGELSFEKGKVIVTPKGVKKLASGALARILKNLSQKGAGTHPVEEKPGYGVELSLHTRLLELGDDYSAIHLERTAMNALSRKGELRFDPEDFEVHEEIQQSRLSAGIIIDESGSMRDARKLSAAMETALVLSKLIMREPENLLRIFVFSDQVKQIQPWAILNQVISGGDTDIRSALSTFRRLCRNDQGDKQVYLITDTEPNLQDGVHIGFDKAANGLIEEASRYRQERIGLNIIMLDEGPEQKELASTLAKKNLGRVFFTSPVNLGEILVEDYLRSRNEASS